MLLALLPKCPMCIMAYGGVFAAAGVSQFLVGPFGTALAVVSVGLIVAFAIRRSKVVFGVASIAAVVSIFGLERQLGWTWGTWVGVSLLLAAYVYEIVRPCARKHLLQHRQAHDVRCAQGN